MDCGPGGAAQAHRTLAAQIPCRRAAGPLNLLIDCAGIGFRGGGEWQTRKHGLQARRHWRKVRLTVGTANSVIRFVEFTRSSDGDSAVRPHLLDQIPRTNDRTVIANSGYHTRRCHSAIINSRRRARAFTRTIAVLPSLPIRKNGDLRMKDSRQHAPETKHCAPPGTMAVLGGLKRRHWHRGSVSLWKH